MEIKELGEGKWKEIKGSYSILNKKTYLKVKDKNRNLKKRKNKKVTTTNLERSLPFRIFW